ncbi:MAG: CPBP family intramembrane metalloprotease [Anaerolineae bacterium]|nr:CPBP family intramembrane metalloprotease [Anaerolineae bacterium]
MEIGLTLFPFVLLSLVLILANLESRDRIFLWLTYLALAGLNFLVVIIGFGLLALSLVDMPEVSLGMVDAYRVLAGAMILTGLLAFVPMIPPVPRLLARWLRVNPGSAVTVTALVYAVYLVGSGIGQQPLLSDPEVLGELGGGNITAGLLWAQALGMVLLAFTGVGFVVRRNWRETIDRLGFKRLTMRHLAIAVGAVIGLFVFQIVYSMVWQALDPAGFGEISDASNLLLGDLTGVFGALTIGLAAALGEEMIFRGALLPPFRLLLTSVLFTVIHSQYGISPAAGIIFVIALVLGVLRYRTSLTVCILVHFGYNFLSVMLPTLGQ